MHRYGIINIFFYNIKQVDSKLLCLCLIIEHKWHTHVMTFISGCSPRGTGTALLHKGQTGTWMS